MCLDYSNARHLWLIKKEMNFKAKFAKHTGTHTKKSSMNRDSEEKKKTRNMKDIISKW